VPLHSQVAFAEYQQSARNKDFPVTDLLCGSVFSLPLHTELTTDIQEYIAATILSYFE